MAPAPVSPTPTPTPTKTPVFDDESSSFNYKETFSISMIVVEGVVILLLIAVIGFFIYKKRTASKPLSNQSTWEA